MRKKTFVVNHCLFAALLLLLPVAVSGQQSKAKSADAVATVKAFYTFHFAHKFDYTLRGLPQRRKWLDAGLSNLLVAELKKPVKKDEVPELDGDPFTNSQEYPTTFRIGNTKESGANASVEIIFIWKEKDKVIDEKGVEVVLVKAKNVWKIANIISGKEPDDDLLHFLKRKP
jgi:hypothetical protein